MTTETQQSQLTWQTYQSSISFVAVIFIVMPKAHCSPYSMAFKIKVIAEAEAVENNWEIAREYGLSESMVRRWRRDQATILSGELKMSAKRATMGRFTPKYPKLDQQVMEWFSEQRDQGGAFLQSFRWVVWEIETTPLCQHANENNTGTAITCRPRREHCVVSPLRDCSQKTCWLPFIPHLQYGWDT